jgi:REP element-mobilizing transposase RayT
MVISPKYLVSKIVETIKSNTSKPLKIKFVFLKKVYWTMKRYEQNGYFVFTVWIREDNQRIRKNAREGRYRTIGV